MIIDRVASSANIKDKIRKGYLRWFDHVPYRLQIVLMYRCDTDLSCCYNN